MTKAKKPTDDQPENQPDPILVNSTLSAEQIESLKNVSSVGSTVIASSTGITIDDSISQKIINIAAKHDLTEEKSKTKLKWFYCSLNYKIPPLSYAVDPSNVYSSQVLENWKELGANGRFTIRFSELLSQFRHEHEARRQSIYDKFDMRKEFSMRIFSHTSAAPIYREVLKWSKEFREQLEKLIADNFEYMVTEFQVNLAAALESAMFKHRKDDGLDDIPNMAAQIASDYVAEKFISGEDLIRDCCVATPMIGEYFRPVTDDSPSTMAEIEAIVEADAEEAKELAKLALRGQMASLKTVTSMLLKDYIDIEIKAVGLFKKLLETDLNLERDADDEDLQRFIPILNCVFSRLAPSKAKTSKAAADAMDIDLIGDRNIIDKFIVEMERADSIKKYKTAYVSMADDCRTLTAQIEDINTRWCEMRGGYSTEYIDMWENMDGEDRFVTVQLQLPQILFNLVAFKSLALSDIEAKEAAKSKSKAKPSEEESVSALVADGDDEPAEEPKPAIELKKSRKEADPEKKAIAHKTTQTTVKKSTATMAKKAIAPKRSRPTRSKLEKKSIKKDS